MLEFMNKNTGCIFCPVEYDSVWTTGIGISSIDILGANGGEVTWKYTKRGTGKEINHKGLFLVKETQNMPP
jgi:hypothetical protein